MVFEEDKFIFDEKNHVIKNPFDVLDSWVSSYYYFRGIKDNVTFDPSLSDIRFFYLRFHGDRNKGRSTSRSPEWDCKYKYQILEALTIAGYEWYFAIDGRIFENNRICWYDLHRDLESDLRAYGDYKEVRLTEFMIGDFRFRKLFRIDSKICQKVVQNYFQLPEGLWPIEGFLVPKDENNEMKEFNLRNRDSDFLIDFLVRYPMAVFSLSDYHADFCFVTNQYTLEAFKQKIKFDQLREEIQQLG